ncbi:type II CAAX prenyl endopeptidase Rce1 family protein [Gillisia hiemivivida]|uniref:CPBP family intramembrane metalloprotease n=1 Tax=Gillisia hiemivivida TaxID=291190 RepID=A0A5C6ZPR3_9FLAO|nr:CPBP family glutamic-type intramembrane protease [Gillisia hiemivivida]TXD92679.1 CPBP family intramembrane metalloprotease [Gillisia hiemivivida]
MIKSIKETFYDLLIFLRNPREREDLNQNLGLKIKQLLSILVIDVVLMIFLTIIISGIEEMGLIDTGSHKIIKLIQELPIWGFMFLIVIIVPIIEEIIFRLYLRFKDNLPIQFLILLASITGNKNKERTQNFLLNKWKKFYKGIFYSSALVFAFVHITNYEYSRTLMFFIPLLLMPQFIVGLLIGYLRLRYGLKWGIYLHSLHNLIFIGTSLIFLAGPIEKVNTVNEKYSLKIEEVGLGRHEIEYSKFDSQSVDIKNVRLKTLISLLLKKEESLIEFNSVDKSNQKININFEKFSNKIENRSTIFKELKSVYKFKMAKRNILQDSWTIQIVDTISLFKHMGNSSGSSSAQISKTMIILKNMNLTQLTNVLASSYDKQFHTNQFISEKFNFKIQKSSFKDLKYSLKSDYGLILKMNRREVEKIRINFNNNENGT